MSLSSGGVQVVHVATITWCDLAHTAFRPNSGSERAAGGRRLGQNPLLCSAPTPEAGHYSTESADRVGGAGKRATAVCFPKGEHICESVAGCGTARSISTQSKDKKPKTTKSLIHTLSLLAHTRQYLTEEIEEGWPRRTGIEEDVVRERRKIAEARAADKKPAEKSAWSVPEHWATKKNHATWKESTKSKQGTQQPARNVKKKIIQSEKASEKATTQLREPAPHQKQTKSQYLFRRCEMKTWKLYQTRNLKNLC